MGSARCDPATGQAWWLDPEVRRIGETSGTAAVQAYLRRPDRQDIPASTVRDRFAAERWKLARPGKAKPSRCAPPVMTRDDKKIGTLNWRDVNKAIKVMQQIKRDASWSQDEAHVTIKTDRPICFAPWGDQHIGGWATNHDTIERITDELISEPYLYTALLGDEKEMAIALRSVAEVCGNLLDPELQDAYMQSWGADIWHKVIDSCWGNHPEMREEKGIGYSPTAMLKAHNIVYHDGIGHLDLKVGDQTYRIALAHFFRGFSIYNPAHSQMRYLMMEGHSREICVAGHTHKPVATSWWAGGAPKAVVNSGSAKEWDPYARRHFSLKTCAEMPCIVLWPDKHQFVPLFSTSQWFDLRASGAV